MGAPTDEKQNQRFSQMQDLGRGVLEGCVLGGTSSEDMKLDQLRGKDFDSVQEKRVIMAGWVCICGWGEEEEGVVILPPWALSCAFALILGAQNDVEP